MGPILIFDKSALQGLSEAEATLLDLFFLTNITPLFYVETLADLEKEDPKGRSPEQVVADLASKTPVMHPHPNEFHQALVLSDLHGNLIDMSRRPVLGQGDWKRASDGRVGVHIKDSPEAKMMARWQLGQFSDGERGQARAWRSSLSGLDFGAMIDWAKKLVPPETKVSSLSDAKAFADSFVRQSGRSILSFALQFMAIPDRDRPDIAKRYADAGDPPFAAFAPYAAFVLKVDLVFYLGMNLNQISPDRPSNKVDISYLYYLPFCMAFTSADKLHERLAPLFMELGQLFVRAATLKAGLKQLRDYYDAHAEDIDRVGLISFASRPPLELETPISMLWDQFLPGWRERQSDPRSEKRQGDSSTKGGPPSNGELLQMINQFTESEGQVPLNERTGEPDFFVMQSTVPVHRAHWRMVSKKVEERSAEQSRKEPTTR